MKRVLAGALLGALLVLGLGSAALAVTVDTQSAPASAPAPTAPPEASQTPKGPPPRLKQVDHRVYRLTVLQVAARTELTEEAVDLYFNEAFTDGCKADFVDTYDGMIMTSVANDEDNVYVESKLLPGWSHIWLPQRVGCE